VTTATRPISIAVDEDIRLFEAGSTGWSADDLDDPNIEAAWLAGRFEIIEGVLARMAPAYFAGGQAQIELIILLRAHFPSKSNPVRFSTEVDLVLSQRRVLRADAIMMTARDKRNQEKAAVKARRKNSKRTRILIPSTLVIESVSPGHEAHDTEIKLRWYAEFGIPNYWIVDAFAQTLVCYRLIDGQYALDRQGKDSDIVKPSAFSPLVIPLASLW
jgi:Uma2 family endonuclease